MERGDATPLECTTRLAVERDLNLLCNLLQDCIDDMRAHGIDQWDDVYPSRATLLADIQSGTAYVATLFEAQLVGFLVLNEYQNPEYAHVAWTINGVPTAVVHRLMHTSGRGLRDFSCGLRRCFEKTLPRADGGRR